MVIFFLLIFIDTWLSHSYHVINSAISVYFLFNFERSLIEGLILMKIKWNQLQNITLPTQE